MNSFIVIVISIVFLGILIWGLTITCPTRPITESWVDYQELPYGNVRSGAGNPGIRPMGFYEYPIYRRPLNWPACHLVDYPVPHCRSDSL